MKMIFKKWWVLLLQGILLIAMGIFFMNHPAEVLLAVSLWVSVFVLASGLLGIFSYFGEEKEERDSGMFWWSLATAAVGVIMISGLGITAKSITLILGVWIVITGIWLARAGWSFRQESALGYLVALLGLFAIISGVAVLFDLYQGAIWISTLIGIEAILSGIALIAIGLVKRNVKGKVKQAIQSKL